MATKLLQDCLYYHIYEIVKKKTRGKNGIGATALEIIKELATNPAYAGYGYSLSRNPKTIHNAVKHCREYLFNIDTTRVNGFAHYTFGKVSKKFETNYLAIATTTTIISDKVKKRGVDNVYINESSHYKDFQDLCKEGVCFLHVKTSKSMRSTTLRVPGRRLGMKHVINTGRKRLTILY